MAKSLDGVLEFRKQVRAIEKNDGAIGGTQETQSELDDLLHQAIEHDQVIVLIAELLKQTDWDDKKNYISAIRDFDRILEETRSNAKLIHEARKKIKSSPSH